MRTYSLYDNDSDYVKFRCPQCRVSYWTDGAVYVCEECDWDVENECYFEELIALLEEEAA